jgi:hypothetical protein
MLEIANVQDSFNNLVETKNETWYQDYTWNKEQEDEFIEYALPLIKKTMKISKDRAKSTLDWFMLCYSLKRNDYE